MQAMRESRTRVTTRIPKLLREHLEQAAAFRGMQLGSFILEAAAEKADSILERERVIHLAAVADVDQVALDPLRADLVNTRGTAVVLEAARDEEIRYVVYGSTIWVYGNAPGSEALDEEVPLASPDHFYTATKLAGEMYCRTYGRMFGLAPQIDR